MQVTGEEIRPEGYPILGYFIRLECPFEISE